VLAALPDEELARRAGVDRALAPALRGARDLVEARSLADLVTRPPERRATGSPETIRAFRAARERGGALDEAAARALVDDLRAGGADLRALRLALTGEPRGPELWAVLVALPREEALRRADVSRTE